MKLIENKKYCKKKLKNIVPKKKLLKKWNTKGIIVHTHPSKP